ncbi:tail fiber protein [Rhizobium lemnae]|uniref:Phage tail protein n=1 Tax=Rhizobium lemnae TaxID=1214924 RepID=A0ABV8ECK6_9HYPH|nr:tail fiber protein [Rhizobium lemnae]MCJ8510697.1 tail fiber protein [Rhizobium lemnae]
MKSAFFSSATRSALTAAIALSGGLLASGLPTPAHACGPESYIGTVCAFSFNYCPINWLPADGRTVAVSNYQALFALISYQYGGNQATNTFALPDLRGRAIVNFGTGPGLPQQVFASQSGVPSTALTVANLPPHNHQAVFTGTGGGQQTVNIPATPGTLGVTATLNAKDEAGGAALNANSYLGKGTTGSGAANIYVSSTSTAADIPLSGLQVQVTGTPGTGATSFTYQTGITGGSVAIGSTGNGAAFSNQSPSLAMNYCIMVNGLWPDRP